MTASCQFASRMIAHMAPHRLRSRRVLQTQSDGLTGWRWWIIRHTPTILIDYLFELLMAIMGAVVCIMFMLDINAETAVIKLVPWWLGMGYAIACGLSSLLIFIGMFTNRYGTAVAHGLRLLAIAGAVYVGAVLTTVGFERAVQAVTLAAAFAILCAWRGFILHSTYLVVSESVKRRRTNQELT